MGRIALNKSNLFHINDGLLLRRRDILASPARPRAVGDFFDGEPLVDERAKRR